MSIHNRCVARSPLPLKDGDVHSSYLDTCVDKLPHGVSLANAHVVNSHYGLSKLCQSVNLGTCMGTKPASSANRFRLILGV